MSSAAAASAERAGIDLLAGAGWYPEPGEHPVENLDDPEVVRRKEIEKRLRLEEAAAATVRAELDPSGIA